MKFLIAAVLITVVAASTTKIRPKLRSTLEIQGNANILVNFVGGNAAALQATGRHAFHDRSARITFLKEQLEQLRAATQQNVQALLTSNGISFKSFWISNQIYVAGASRDLVEALAEFPEVSNVIKEPEIRMNPVTKHAAKSTKISKKDDELVWGLKTIDVETAWKYTNGSGVVVGTKANVLYYFVGNTGHIDSGVRHSHETLRDSFVGVEYGWYDTVLGKEEPYDDMGHGTHTMGTIVGTKGIGIAPGAKWMTCQACPSFFECLIPYFVECAEWIVCPTKVNGTDPDCSKAPHLVSNSWGGLEADGDDFFEGVGAAWPTAGIIPVFGAGNEGDDGCSSLRYPGSANYTIGLGATNINDEIAWFSSLGPAPNGDLKPDLSAPGENITSAYADDDDAYGLMSGTSMATPHGSGIITLMLSVNPNMTFTQIRETLLTSGVDSESLVSHNTTCGGTSDKEFPNNIYGYGRLNAGKAVLAAIQSIKN